MHHAYLYEGSVSLLDDLADSACEIFGFRRENNPDVYVRQWEKFGIDESRDLAQLASLRSTSGRSLFVLGVISITSHAQQTLLKLFEEPKAGAIFVLLAPHGALLPTLRSRFLEYPKKMVGKEGIAGASNFLASPYARRSTWISDFVKDEENTKERVRNFVQALEVELYSHLKKTTGSTQKEIRAGLEDISHFRSYLSDTAPSLKMILEHFAATLPKL